MPRILKVLLLPWLLQLANASPFAKRLETNSITISTVASISVIPAPTPQTIATVNAALATATVSIPSSYTLPDAPDPMFTAANAQATTPPSCSLQPQDPDEGITEAYCDCGSTKLPVLNVTNTNADPNASCAYSGSATAVQPISEQSLSTFTSNCMVCSNAVINERACSTISGCTPTIPPYPTMSVQAANVKANFGQWLGADAGPGMYNNISSLLNDACPTPSRSAPVACASTDLTVPIDYVDPTGALLKGEVVFNIAGSNYTDLATRNQLIAVVAGGFASSASGKNCGNTEYIGLCPDQTTEQQVEDGEGCKDNITTCYSSNAFYAQLFPSQYTDQPLGFLWTEAAFQKPASDQALVEFICELVVDAIEGGELLTQPELAGLELPIDIEWQAECLDALQGG